MSIDLADVAALTLFAGIITGLALLSRAINKASARMDDAIDEIARTPLPPALAEDHLAHAHVGYRCSYCQRHVTVCVVHVAIILQLVDDPKNCPDCATIAALDRQASNP